MTSRRAISWALIAAGLYSVALIGDINGDGHADIAVGPQSTTGAGRTVEVYLGAATPSSLMPSLSLTAAGPLYGDVSTGIGDVNGDGYADVVIGSAGSNSNHGAVFLYWGGPSGLDATRMLRIDAPTGAMTQFGTVVAGRAMSTMTASTTW